MKTALAAALTLAPLTAAAQTVENCDWRASAQALVEPWGAYSSTFANGEVRLALTDTIEPGAGSLHVVVLSPPYDELGGRQCKVVSFDGSIGYTQVDWSSLEAGYDPAVGLIFDIQTLFVLMEENFSNAALLTITVNQATGEVTARHLLGND